MRASRGTRGRGRRAVQPNVQLRGPPNTGWAREQGGNDRRMELITSVSRSSGLENDGDLLKEFAVQEEFRTFINKKLKTFWHTYESGSFTTHQLESVQKQKRDNQESILILFRKLREGLSASAYETSLYLSVIFHSPTQTTSILSRLVPYIYVASPGQQPYRLTTIVILLLHHLVISFPSQRAFLEQIESIVPNLLERPSAAHFWITLLARSLRTSNFVQFEKLSHPDAFEHLLPSTYPISDGKVSMVLPRNAVHVLVSRLRLKVREKAWSVVRHAYRELSSSDEMQMWLGRRLFFDNFGSEATVVKFDEWVREKCRDGHLRPKEGVEGRWMVCKAR